MDKYTIKFDEIYDLLNPPLSLKEEYLRNIYNKLTTDLSISDVYLINDKEMLSNKTYTKIPFVVIQEGITQFEDIKQKKIQRDVIITKSRTPLNIVYFNNSYATLDLFVENFIRLFYDPYFISTIQPFTYFYFSTSFLSSYKISFTEKERALQCVVIEIEANYEIIYNKDIEYITVNSAELHDDYGNIYEIPIT